MTFYITTPIYYVNDLPHIGHAYSTVVADVLTRYHKLFGEQTFFLTGTDEHGQKVQNAAKAQGRTAQEQVDQLVVRFQEVWKELGIDYNFFIRTTMPLHKAAVQDVLKILFDKGEIYLHEYEGWYSVSEEIFYTEKDLVNGKSPEGKEVQRVVERNYFFRMSKYQTQLIEYIEKHPNFIQPAGKKSEVLGFLRQPLSDLCISRPKTRLEWGIELPFDTEYVTYVWFDALLNYISGLGYKQSAEGQKNFDLFWPEAIHLIGKDILVPHTIYWPTMLMALGIPLPKTIFAHGWWLTDNQTKMSKSVGPVVRPLDLKELVGVDSFRYFLCRDIVLGNDAEFSTELVISRVNSELANNFGNLISRTINLLHKFFDGKVPPNRQDDPRTKELNKEALELAQKLKTQIESFALQDAIGSVVQFLSSVNRYIDAIAPWKTAKEDLNLAGESLYAALESIRIAGVLLSPVMPQKMLKLRQLLGLNAEPKFDEAFSWGVLQPGTSIEKPEALFPRIDLKAQI